MLGSIFEKYDRQFYFWELVILSRKLLLVLLSKFTTAYPELQIGGSILVGACFNIIHINAEPYIHNTLDTLEALTQTCEMLLSMSAFIFLLGIPPGAILFCLHVQATNDR